MPLTSMIGRRLATASIALITAASGVAVTAGSAAADVGDQPTITSLTPATGPEAGGTEVTITGTDFIDVTGVSFGGTPATSFDTTDGDATTITAVAPEDSVDAPNDVDVTVTTAEGGTSAANANTTYSYTEDAPTITGLSPDNGPEAGGNTVTISGNDFTGASAVQFGIINATSFTVVNDTTITAVAPADPFPAPNSFDVSVTTDAGKSATNENTSYAYNDTTPDPPAITSLSPTQGPAAGGTRVTIQGTGFSADSTVKFGSVTAANPSFNQNTGAITVDSPADSPAPAAGSVDRVQVTVTEGGQTSNGATFTYGVAPVVSSISPATGPDSGGTTVTITGKGFTPGSSVRFGGATADQDDVRYVSSTQLEVTTPPAGFPGTTTFGVFVTSPYGTSNGDQTFTYTAKATPGGSPTLTAGPASVPFGSTVTLSGTSDPGATVQIFFQVKGQEGFDARRSLVVGEDGTFSTTYRAAQDERYYAQVGDDTTRQSAQGLTQVAPTVTGPLTRTVKKNSTAVISGRAGIDSDSVLIHFHKAGTPADDYSIVRSVPVNESGQYTRPYQANVDYRFFVTAENGVASPNYLYQAR